MNRYLSAEINTFAQTPCIIRFHHHTHYSMSEIAEQSPLLKAIASHGSSRLALRNTGQLDLFVTENPVAKNFLPGAPVLSKIKSSRFFSEGEKTLKHILRSRSIPAPTVNFPARNGTSAGKNTYTYDAHTYHTKVPPQGIVEFLKHYLPQGGFVLDPFGGSGMTGVAALVAGMDVVLNELSPAACFISHNFTERVSNTDFARAIKSVLSELTELRKELYSTECRECGKHTEILYTVWSYQVQCPHCQSEFRLWDHCRQYGSNVREHKILSEFPCPNCDKLLKKSRLLRKDAEPVILGYKCCDKIQREHPLSPKDMKQVQHIEAHPPLAEGFYPNTHIPEGINLNQPKRHGFDTIDKFYTKRNLSALSHLWREIHRLENSQLTSMLAFVFTSLYQRVTRLSEFRFWGGSGNTAHFNVPFIFNEANVFATFERKAASILDHLQTTALHYRDNKVVVCNSATQLDYLPDNSVDFIFTDPPFGANINYSEMNILWESWLGEFTDNTSEAIVSRIQGKGLTEYEHLMSASLSECYRVLRPGHWMLLVFMNSSGKVWEALNHAVRQAGFEPEQINIFDKQHGTFKQFVNENTAGSDLVLHCRKPADNDTVRASLEDISWQKSIARFFDQRTGDLPVTIFLHVARNSESDFRTLFSEWIGFGLLKGHQLTDFSNFKAFAERIIEKNHEKKP